MKASRAIRTMVAAVLRCDLYLLNDCDDQSNLDFWSSICCREDGRFERESTVFYVKRPQICQLWARIRTIHLRILITPLVSRTQSQILVCNCEIGSETSHGWWKVLPIQCPFISTPSGMQYR